MKIKIFAESIEPPYRAYYVTAGGRKRFCDEEKIEILWSNWAVNRNAKRGPDKDGFTIFEFSVPVEVFFETAENWFK